MGNILCVGVFYAPRALVPGVALVLRDQDKIGEHGGESENKGIVNGCDFLRDDLVHLGGELLIQLSHGGGFHN